MQKYKQGILISSWEKVISTHVLLFPVDREDMSTSYRDMKAD